MKSRTFPKQQNGNTIGDNRASQWLAIGLANNWAMREREFIGANIKQFHTN